MSFPSEAHTYEESHLMKLKTQRTSKSPCMGRATYASAPKVPMKTTAAEFLAAKSACI